MARLVWIVAVLFSAACAHEADGGGALAATLRAAVDGRDLALAACEPNPENSEFPCIEQATLTVSPRLLRAGPGQSCPYAEGLVESVGLSRALDMLDSSDVAEFSAGTVVYCAVVLAPNENSRIQLRIRHSPSRTTDISVVIATAIHVDTAPRAFVIGDGNVGDNELTLVLNLPRLLEGLTVSELPDRIDALESPDTHAELQANLERAWCLLVGEREVHESSPADCVASSE